jgi:polyhydroxyalkanoate synthesis regulator phasin
MLKTLFDRYKYVLVAILFVAYSVFVWNVSSTNTEAKWVAKALDAEVANGKLIATISTKLEDALSKQAKLNKDGTKELLDELAKDPRYKSCTTTDGVRNNLKRKLDNQPKLP